MALREYMYKLLHDAYFHEGMFDRGGALIRFPRESTLNYKHRQKQAYYLNYVGPIVDGSVTPVFKDEIKRNYRDTDKFKMFIDDVDRLGTSFQTFMRRNAILAKLYGVIYVLVNNSMADGLTDADNLANRSLPYLTCITPEQIEQWLFDESGHIKEFTYRVQMKDENGWIIRYYTWTKDMWRVADETKQVIESGPNALGVVPIVQWFGRDTDPTNMLPTSEFYAIAQTNKHIYNLCSLLSQISHEQTFNVLTLPSIGQVADVTIGTNNVLAYPDTASHAPAFISPDSGPATIIMEQIQTLISEMYRMSGLNSVIGVESTKSGVAKQWDFENTNQKLADFAGQCEKVERAIIRLYELWTNENIDYVCEYQRDFKINDVADCLSQAQQAIDFNLDSKTFKLELAKKILEAYMPNIPPDIYDAIINELEAASEVITQNNAYKDVLHVGDTDDNATND